MQIRRNITVLSVALAICVLGLAQAKDSVLIKNASFEQSEGGLPVAWKTATWGGQSRFSHVSSGRTGDKCVMISSENGADASWTTMVEVNLPPISGTTCKSINSLSKYTVDQSCGLD